MKKITFLIAICLINLCAFAQTNPTFSWTNQSDITIGSELIVKPGDVLSYSIDYTLGSMLVEGTDTPNTFSFVLFSIQSNTNLSATVYSPGWTAFSPAVINYPGAGTGGTTTGSITIPGDTELTSAGNKIYRILCYLAYNKADGTGVTYGGTGASDPQIINVKSAEEVALLSLDKINNNSVKSYPNPTSGVVYFNEESSFFNVYDLVGNLVLSKGKGNSLDLTSLTNGIYTVVSENGTSKVVKK